MDESTVINRTRQWISSMVVGLGLCPFAKKPFDEQTIRYVVSDATDGSALLEELASELRALAATPAKEVETTLLIHPAALGDFLDYNDFLEIADGLVDDLGFTGVIQLASFHPRYQFADTNEKSPENYTNRSPYPMLHLLREQSISAVVQTEEEMMAIPQRNVKLLQEMGLAKILERLKG